MTYHILKYFQTAILRLIFNENVFYVKYNLGCRLHIIFHLFKNLCVAFLGPFVKNDLYQPGMVACAIDLSSFGG